ncbi:putative glycoside hydrolase [Methanobrevibacter sp.]
MKSKIILMLSIVLILLFAVATVSANDNATANFTLTQEISLDENPTSDVLKDDSQDNVIEEVENKSSTEISMPDKVSYTDYQDSFKITLTSNGVGLADKNVTIIFNNQTFDRVTDNEGSVIIDFKLKTGTYHADYYFYGDDNYTASNGTSEITIKSNIVTKLSFVDKKINYCEGVKAVIQIKLVDVYNRAVSGKTITVKVNGKKYTAKTNSKGIATFYLNLKKGTHTITYSFSESGNYIGSSGSHKLQVKTKLSKGNGYWVNKWSMKKVNLKTLYKKGTKHIFLQHTVFDKYGKKTVVKWIKKAHKYGMKVHIWIAVFYKNGKYVHASNKKGTYNYKHMNSILKKAKYYASIKEVDGIHFDYLRFGGNAYKFKNAAAAINYFVKKANSDIRAVNPDVILSAAVMPEPNDMKKYYGQDFPTISKYLDVVVPMIYKGNYHASSKWIKKVTNQFVKKSKGAKIWAGLQSYKSDSNIKKLSYNSLMKDAKYAKKGGASGIVLFRWGLSALLNFKKV